MDEPPGGLRLVLEAREDDLALALFEQHLLDHLERDVALDLRVHALVDDAHAAAADHPLDRVLADAFRDGHGSAVS